MPRATCPFCVRSHCLFVLERTVLDGHFDVSAVLEDSGSVYPGGPEDFDGAVEIGGDVFGAMGVGAEGNGPAPKLSISSNGVAAGHGLFQVLAER